MQAGGRGKSKKRLKFDYYESKSEERMRKRLHRLLGRKFFVSLFIWLVMMVFACVQLSISVQILE
jgi:hypothetical protein